MSRVSPKKTIRDLERLSVDKGAHRAKAFSARLVAMDERVRMKCQIPLCPHYGETLTCPPNVPTVEEFSRVVDRYEVALLLQTRSAITGEVGTADRNEVLGFVAEPRGKRQKTKEESWVEKDLSDMKLAAIRLHKLVNDVESAAMSLGFPYALGLIGGECMLCPQCVGQKSGEGCRRPYQARPSMEGVGIDVVKTCIDAGLPFDIPPKKEIIWSGLVLVS